MYKTQKILISLLLMAVFVSSCSKPAESQKQELMAQTERLIDKLVDNIVEFLDAYYRYHHISWEGSCSLNRDNFFHSTKKTFRDLCDLLEKEETECEDTLRARLYNLANGANNYEEVSDLVMSIVRCDSNKTNSDVVAAISEVFGLNISANDAALWQLLTIIAEDIINLAKVMKQIRELT